MSNVIPTVRVAHPENADAFMTINASDYRPEHHGELWHTQMDGFTGLPPAPPESYTKAERELAADIMLESMVLRERALRDRDFSRLQPNERLTILRDAKNELESSKAEYDRHALARRQEATEEATRLAREAAANGAAEQAAREAQGSTAESKPATDKIDEPVKPEEKAPEQPQQQAESSQAPAGGTAPAWAAAKPAQQAADAPKTVEKGPGSKYYVMQNGKPVSEGFAKKADADALLAQG